MEDTTKAGNIEVRQGKRGIEFHTFNHERGGVRHIGTLAGVTYEKQAQILQKPERSFALTDSELKAVEENGGEFIRIVCQGATYSISLEDFKNHGEKFFNPSYGQQTRTALRWWVSVVKVSKRNKRTDNPVIATSQPVIKQIPMFG